LRIQPEPVEVHPNEAILLDLESKIKRWQEEDNQVIILSNFNADIRVMEVQTQFLELGLDKVYLSLHGPLVPATIRVVFPLMVSLPLRI